MKQVDLFYFITFFPLLPPLLPLPLLLLFLFLYPKILFEIIALEYLEEFAVDAGYEDLLRKLYKEMMMMGYLSFGIFLAFNAAGVKHDQQYLAFEFSHITTFFMTIFFVIRACLFVRYTRTAKNYFKDADDYDIEILMNRYQSIQTSPYSVEAVLYKYFPVISILRMRIEYQILKAHFFKNFKLISSEFRFVNYLSKG